MSGKKNIPNIENNMCVQPGGRKRNGGRGNMTGVTSLNMTEGQRCSWYSVQE